MLDVTKFVGELHDYIARALSPLSDRLKALESRQVERGEKGEPGEPGRDADPVDSDAVADAVLAKLLASDRLKTLADLAASTAVVEHFEANPVRHGKDGRDGADGEQGPQGEKGDQGAAGSDGVGLADALIDRDGALVITMTDGRAKSLGPVVGRDGADGRDGIAFDKCIGEFDPARGYVLRFMAGDTVSEHVLPYMRHGGFWSEGKSAMAGESWTQDGALYIAKRDTTAKPCIENKEDWILAARKGRDGKDGRNGVDKTAAVQVFNHA